MNDKILDSIKKVALKNNVKLDLSNLSLTLKNSGIDSLALLNLIFNLEEELNIKLDDDKLQQIKTLQDLIILIQETINLK